MNVLILFAAIIAFIIVRWKLKAWRIHRAGKGYGVDEDNVLEVYRAARHRKITTNLTCLGVYVLFFIIVGYLMFGTFVTPSPVKISPLEQLKEVDFSNMDKLIKNLEDARDELGEQFKETEVKDENKWYFSYTYFDRSIPASAFVFIRVYKDSETAKEECDNSRSSLSKIPCKSRKLSEDIEVFLYSYTIRNVEMFNSPSDRMLQTYIRINNMYIYIIESNNIFGPIGQASNRSIEVLCEVLAG